MAKKKKEEPQKPSKAWMDTFSDLMNLLLCFFVLLFSMSTVDAQKFEAIAASFSQTFSIFNGGQISIGEGMLLGNGVSQLNELDQYMDTMGKEAENEEETDEIDEMQQKLEDAKLEESEKLAERIEEAIEESQMEDMIQLDFTSQYVHYLILDGLHTAADLLTETIFYDGADLLLGGSGTDGLHLGENAGADLLTAHLYEGSQVGQGDGLTAVLIGGNLGHDLGGDVAGGGKGVGPLDQRAGDNRAVLQHILQIDQIAVVHVLCVVVRVVEMDDALVVGLDDLLRQKNTVGDIPGNLTRHVVTLGGVDDGILIGVFLLGLLVVAFDEAEDLVVGGVGLTNQITGIAVGYVGASHLKGTVCHDLLLHHVLYFLHPGGAAQFLAGEDHALRDAADLGGSHADALVHSLVGLGDGADDLGNIKYGFRAVSLDDLHTDWLSFP